MLHYQCPTCGLGVEVEIGASDDVRLRLVCGKCRCDMCLTPTRDAPTALGVSVPEPKIILGPPR